MTLLSYRAFAAHLDRLEREAFLGLVEDIWTGLGWTTARIGADVHISRDRGGEQRGERRLRPVLEEPSGDPFDGQTVPDTVVAAFESDRWQRVADQQGLRYVDPRDLYGMLRYGLDREVADRLCREWFDRPLDSNGQAGRGLPRIVAGVRSLLWRWRVSALSTRRGLPGVRALTRATAEAVKPQQWVPDRVARQPTNARQPTDARDRTEGRPHTEARPRTDWRPRTRHVALFLVLGAILLGVLYVASPTPPAERTASAAQGQQSLPESGEFPGLEAGGRVDIEELASAHRAAVADRGYRLTISHENSRGILVTAFRWHHSEQVVTVTALDRFAYSVDGTLPGQAVGTPDRSLSFEEYGNGTRCNRRFGPAADDEPTRETDCQVLRDGDPVEQLAGLPAAALRRYLHPPGTTVRRIETDGTTRYVLLSTRPHATIDRAVEDYRATALVRPTGLVESLHVSYRLKSSDGPRQVTFDLHHRRVGNGTAGTQPDRIDGQQSGG